MCNLYILLIGEISAAFLEDSFNQFASDPKNILAKNAVTNSKWGDILINRDEFQQKNNCYSVKLNDMKVTSQKQSGRCWIFAALNMFRRTMAEKYKLAESFELSQPYLFFWVSDMEDYDVNIYTCRINLKNATIFWSRLWIPWRRILKEDWCSIY